MNSHTKFKSLHSCVGVSELRVEALQQLHSKVGGNHDECVVREGPITLDAHVLFDHVLIMVDSQVAVGRVSFLSLGFMSGVPVNLGPLHTQG